MSVWCGVSCKEGASCRCWIYYLDLPNWNFELSVFNNELVLYSHMPYHNDAIIKTQEDFFRKIFVPLTLFVRIQKGCVGFYCERELENITAIFWPHSYGRQRCVFLVLLMLNRRPRAHSAGWWLSLLHLISNLSPTLTHQGPKSPSAWCGFPYHISSITRLISNCNSLDFCLDWVI